MQSIANTSSRYLNDAIARERSSRGKVYTAYSFFTTILLKGGDNPYKGGRLGPTGIRRGSKRFRRSPAGSAVTLFTLSIKGALRSLHFTCLSVLPLSTSFIMLAQSGRFLGLDFNISSFCIWQLLSNGRSLRIVLLGGGGGGRGGGGGGIFARDELFDKVGAPGEQEIISR